jgi:hypothetical protein
MSSVQMLLVVLLLLYLSEFVVWVRPDVWFFRHRGRGWEVVARGGIFTTPRGSLHWVYPIPVLSRAYLVPVHLPYTGQFPSASGEPSAVRDPVDAIERQRQRVEKAFQPLRWASWGLMTLTWIAAPILLQFLGIGPMLYAVVPGLVLLMVSNAWGLYRVHRRLFPASDDERLRLVLSACLSPLAAIRSVDLAQKEAVAGFHPLAVAAALPGFHGWEAIAAEEWRRLKYSEPTDPPVKSMAHPAPPAEDSATMGGIEALAQHRGINTANWDKAPEREDSANSQYCPRCRSQFTRQAVTCHDCRRSTLLPFPEGP